MTESTPQIPESERTALERDSRREEFDLKQEEAYRFLLSDYHKQIIRFRLYTIIFSSIVVALLSVLVIWSLCWGPLSYVSDDTLTHSESIVALNIALIVAPVIAVTTITVFILIGVFRGFRDRDMGNVPVQTILRNVGTHEG